MRAAREHDLGEGARRSAIDKATPVTVTAGVFIAIIIATWVVSQRTSAYEQAVSELQTEITTLRTDLTSDIVDVAKRQGKYVGIQGLYTEQIADLDHEIHSLREWIAATHGEIP